MMAVSRDARARRSRTRRAHVWERRLWSTLNGKTAVIVGIGVVGIAIGELLKALGMTVIGVTRTPRAVAGFDDMMPTDRLAEAATPRRLSDQRSAGDAPTISGFSTPRCSPR